MTERRRLPERRMGLHLKTKWNRFDIYISTGYYDDGLLGEVFVSAGKLTTGLDTAAKDSAIAISLALQYGCPPEVLEHAFLRQDDGKPEGLAGHVMRAIVESGLGRIPPFKLPHRTLPEPPEPVVPPVTLPGANLPIRIVPRFDPVTESTRDE